MLLNSTTVSKEARKKTLQHLEEEKLISNKAANSIEEELSETDTYNEKSDSKTTVSGHIQNFAGRTEFYNWTYEFPDTKHRVAGVILVWSPKTAAYARGIKSGHTSSNAKSRPSTGKGTLPSTVVRGIDSDF